MKIIPNARLARNEHLLIRQDAAHFIGDMIMQLSHTRLTAYFCFKLQQASEHIGIA